MAYPLAAWLLFCVFCFFPLPPAQAAGPEPPGLLLANVYHDQIDLEDYWVSEKLDGVRAYWDGRRLISRQGNVFQAPAWFTRNFPATPLDGELWMGRGTFERLSGTVRQQVPDEVAWRQVRYMVFDLPAAEGVFDQRLEQLRDLVQAVGSPYLQLVEQFRVESREELLERLSLIVSEGGEGLMLHRGSSLYQASRSDDLLKLKTYEDAEAVVVGHLPGKGKYEGMLGALLVETPEKLRFRIGTGFTDAERASPPPIGSTVTYKFYGRTRNGIPRFASFLRVREEL